MVTSIKKVQNIWNPKKNLTSWRKSNSSLRYIIRKLKDAFLVYSKYEKFNFFKSIFFVSFLSINFLKKEYYSKIK